MRVRKESNTRKNNKMKETGMYLSTETPNVNGLYSPNKRQTG
jgi:hypothetical protein